MDKNASGRNSSLSTSSLRRINWWYVGLIFVCAVIIARLFYLQVIRHDYYRKAALSDQLKQYSIAAQRGIIEAQDGGNNVPIVLNQQLYTLYVDPSFVGRGTGRALLAGAFDAFKERKLRSCLIWAHARNNACFFYEAMGGMRVATRTTRLLGELTPEIGFGWKRLATARQTRSLQS